MTFFTMALTITHVESEIKRSIVNKTEKSVMCNAVVFSLGSFAFFWASRELVMKVFIITFIIYAYMKPLFVVAKIIGSTFEMVAYFFIQNCLM